MKMEGNKQKDLEGCTEKGSPKLLVTLIVGLTTLLIYLVTANSSYQRELQYETKKSEQIAVAFRHRYSCPCDTSQHLDLEDNLYVYPDFWDTNFINRGYRLQNPRFIMKIPKSLEQIE
jgi:hypothetical protein